MTRYTQAMTTMTFPGQTDEQILDMIDLTYGEIDSECYAQAPGMIESLEADLAGGVLSVPFSDDLRPGHTDECDGNYALGFTDECICQ